MSDRRLSPACLDEAQVAVLRDSVRAELEVNSEWADLWNIQGLLHAYEGEIDNALDAFRHALQINPDYVGAVWNSRWIELLADPARDFDGDPPGLESAVQPNGLLALIRDLLQSKSRGPELRPTGPVVAFSLLAVHAARSDSAAFGKTLDALRSMEPKLDQLFRLAGLGSAEAPDETRIAEFGRPEMLNPGFHDLLERAGRLESIAGRTDEARRLFALAALLQGNRAAFLVEEAEILSRQRRLDEVLPILREAVSERPDWYRTHLALGYELSVQGIVDEALHHVETAVDLQPLYPDVHYQYGLLLHAAGRNEEAIATMEEALRQNPGYLVARIALANLLFEESREAYAAPHYARVFEEGIETPSLAGRFGYSLHAAGARTRAEELFLEAISQDRERPDLLCLYGMFLSETDRALEARTVWERALRCQPSRDTRRRLETMLGETPPED